MRIKTRRHLPRLLVILLFAVALIFPASTTCAAAPNPREDVLGWYEVWLEQVPKNYEMQYAEYFDRDESKPLRMEFANWNVGLNRVCVVTNSEHELQYRVIENDDYCASLEGFETHKDQLDWTISGFAAQGDSQRDAISSGTGTSPDFLGIAEFRTRPYKMERSESGTAGSRVSRVDLVFQDKVANKPRARELVSVYLDESIGWMPVAVEQKEIGGLTSRKTLDGWRHADEKWTFKNIRTFVKLPSAEQEVLHSTEDWSFELMPQKSRLPECYLKYYDLPEPAGVSSGSKVAWRPALLVVGILLCITGLTVAKRRR